MLLDKIEQLVYNTKEMDDEALQYYTKSKYYYKKFNSEVDIAVIDFNVTNISVQQTGKTKTISLEKRNEAIKVYERVKEIFKKNEEYIYYTKAVYALGVQLTETDKLQEGLKFYLEAEEIALLTKDNITLISIYRSMAENYRKSNIRWLNPV